MTSASDPNFPPSLDIYPLLVDGREDTGAQASAIAQYGIAGRVWEASRALLEYFSPSVAFDPPCSIFRTSALCILELGSGQSVASLHLATQLDSTSTLILTDLPNVVPLCQQSISRQSFPGRVVAEPLPWGITTDIPQRFDKISHIILCDLVYFPHLYPALLFSLLQLTEGDESGGSADTFGPEIILAYQSRTLSLEESFFDALGQYFQLTPVTGGTWEASLFICRRWNVTTEWVLPNLQTVMLGSKAVIRGRGYDFVDGLYGSLEL